MQNINSDDLSTVSSNSDKSNIAVPVVLASLANFQVHCINLEWDPTCSRKHSLFINALITIVTATTAGVTTTIIITATTAARVTCSKKQ